MPLPLLAIPVLHASGAWIASAGGCYLAGTLSSTWIGAFVLGNTALVSAVGLVTGASAVAISGATIPSTTTAAIKAATLTKAGLAGLAVSGLKGAWNARKVAAVAPAVAIAPAWVIAGVGSASLGAAGYLILRKKMKELNEERVKGGLPPITIAQLIKEIRLYQNRRPNDDDAAPQV
jgi:hypothetical protein